MFSKGKKFINPYSFYDFSDGRMGRAKQSK